MVERWSEEIWKPEVRFLISTWNFSLIPLGDEMIKRFLYLKFQWLTTSPTEASVESLCVDMVDVFSISPMKQLSFTISSRIFIHFLFSYHVRLIQMRILYAFNLLNIKRTGCFLKLTYDILILRGAWLQFYFMYSRVMPGHRCPVLW